MKKPKRRPKNQPAPEKPPALRRPWLALLFQHGRYLQYNLSVYFSPNTHLQGEAVALHALGLLFREHPASAAWCQTGSAILEEIIQTHVRADGATSNSPVPITFTPWTCSCFTRCCVWMFLRPTGLASEKWWTICGLWPALETSLFWATMTAVAFFHPTALAASFAAPLSPPLIASAAVSSRNLACCFSAP